MTATVHGPLVRIQWSATTGGDPASTYQISLGSYNGTFVALVPASVRDCYISGLNPSAAYTIFVTAYDAQGHWSGPLSGTQGNRKTTITTSSHGGAGPNLWCHTSIDTDGDGLPNGVETNNGTYQGAGKTGTDPANPDTDNDGIPDGEEALGTSGVDSDADGVPDGVGYATGGLNLLALGARPTHKDLLIEFDWLDNPACPGGGHRPTAAAMAMLVPAYANAPVANPDGTTGIKFIADYGQGGAFTGGNLVPDTDGAMGHVSSSEFRAVKVAHTAPARRGIFHYALAGAHGSHAEGWGNDIRLGRSCNNPDTLDQAATIMHEVGHNLGLFHGGDDAEPFFPNYNSVMNYRYSEGIDTDCDGTENKGFLDYSQGLNAPLDESALDETIGICDGPDQGSHGDPIDWNRNGVIDTQLVQADINNDDEINLDFGYVVRPLEDFDDWARVDEEGLACVRFVGIPPSYVHCSYSLT